jgi:hypothetical protein
LVCGEARGLEFENGCSAHGKNPIIERGTGEVAGSQAWSLLSGRLPRPCRDVRAEVYPQPT